MRNYTPEKWQKYATQEIKEKRRKQHRDDYRKNKEKYILASREYKQNRRKEVIDFLGGRCNRCGFDDIRALQIDHLNGGGTREQKELGMTKMLSKILKIKGKGYQVLCANCNSIKRVENREHSKGYSKYGMVA